MKGWTKTKCSGLMLRVCPVLRLHPTCYMALLPSSANTEPVPAMRRVVQEPRHQRYFKSPAPSLKGCLFPGTRDSASPMITAPHNLKYVDGLTLFQWLCYIPDGWACLECCPYGLLCIKDTLETANWHSFVQGAPSIPGTVLNPWERLETKPMFSWSLQPRGSEEMTDKYPKKWGSRKWPLQRWNKTARGCRET